MKFIFQFGFIFGLIVLFIFGLMLWISPDFSHALAIRGLGRLFGGLISMVVSAILMTITARV